EHEGALARPGDAREDGDPALGQVDGHVLEVVLVRADHADAVVTVGRMLRVRHARPLAQRRTGTRCRGLSSIDVKVTRVMVSRAADALKGLRVQTLSRNHFTIASNRCRRWRGRPDRLSSWFSPGNSSSSASTPASL